MAPLPAWPPMLLFFNKTRVDGSGLPCFLETPPAWCFARKGFSSRGLEQVPGVTCGAERPLSLCWQPLRGLRCSLGSLFPLTPLRSSSTPGSGVRCGTQAAGIRPT